MHHLSRRTPSCSSGCGADGQRSAEPRQYCSAPLSLCDFGYQTDSHDTSDVVTPRSETTSTTRTVSVRSERYGVVLYEAILCGSTTDTEDDELGDWLKVDDVPPTAAVGDQGNCVLWNGQPMPNGFCAIGTLRPPAWREFTEGSVKPLWYGGENSGLFAPEYRPVGVDFFSSLEQPFGFRSQVVLHEAWRDVRKVRVRPGDWLYAERGAPITETCLDQNLVFLPRVEAIQIGRLTCPIINRGEDANHWWAQIGQPDASLLQWFLTEYGSFRSFFARGYSVSRYVYSSSMQRTFARIVADINRITPDDKTKARLLFNMVAKVVPADNVAVVNELRNAIIDAKIVPTDELLCTLLSAQAAFTDWANCRSAVPGVTK